MPPLLRRSAPLVLLLFALARTAYGEVVTLEGRAELKAERQQSAESTGPVQEGQVKLRSILLNPPTSFWKLSASVPLSIYGKDKDGNYVCFCDSSKIDWGVVNQVKPGELREYVKYFALFFWFNVDRRSNSSLTLVVDADGFSMSTVLNGCAKTVLDSILAGLDDTQEFVGNRPGRVFIINAPRFLSPLINFISRWLPDNVTLASFSGRDKWSHVLRDHIGAKHLPDKYGGTSRTPLEQSVVNRYISESVAKLIEQKAVAPTNKQ